eukprot:2992436-Amphidinium_carterae.1
MEDPKSGHWELLTKREQMNERATGFALEGYGLCACGLLLFAMLSSTARPGHALLQNLQQSDADAMICPPTGRQK